jgi:outer membrane protein assembly factor BamB
VSVFPIQSKKSGLRRLGLVAFGLAALLSSTSFAQPHWPQFRGPAASGVSTNSSFPTHFGPQSNVVWKIAVPSGHSSPCIWGDRIFLTGFASNRLVSFALDRGDGRLLWRRELEPAKLERGAAMGSPATATAATDGRRVCVYFGTFGLACYDLDGAELWRKPLPTPITQHGAGTSPVLAGDRVVLLVDQDVGSYLLAVDARTGEDLWRVDRSAYRRGFSTPLLWPAAQPELAIVAGTLRLVAYDLRDGQERWLVRGLPNEMVSSPTAADGLLYVAGWTHGAGVSRVPPFDELLEAGDRNQDGQLTQAEATGPARQHFHYIDADKDGAITRAEYDAMAAIFNQSQNVCLAVRPGGRGDVTDTRVAWKQTRGLPYVPSPLCYEGRLYLVKNGGLASCFDAKTGEIHYLEERLGALGDYYASPVAGGGKLCVVSQQGVAVVWRAGDTLEVLARNALGEQVMATPAIVDERLYLRTKGFLYAFGEK